MEVGRVVSDTKDAILPLGTEADITDLNRDSPLERGCKYRLYLKELGNPPAFCSSWAGEVVGLVLGMAMCPCRREERAAPAAFLLSRLSRSVCRVCSWVVVLLGQHV